MSGALSSPPFYLSRLALVVLALAPVVWADDAPIVLKDTAVTAAEAEPEFTSVGAHGEGSPWKSRDPR